MKVFYSIVLGFIVMVNSQLFVAKDGVRHVFYWRKQLTEIDEKIVKVREKNARIGANINDLKHSNDGVESRARYELGMIKPGEQFIQFVWRQPTHQISKPETATKAKTEAGDKQ
jgi:cell division protein FtsB